MGTLHLQCLKIHQDTVVFNRIKIRQAAPYNGYAVTGQRCKKRKIAVTVYKGGIKQNRIGQLFAVGAVIRNLPVRQKITLGIGTPLTDCCTGCRIRIADKDDKSMRIRQYGGRICLNRKLCTGIKRSRFICVDIFIVTVIFLSYKT